VGDTRYPSGPERTRILYHLQAFLLLAAATIAVLAMRSRIQRWVLGYDKVMSRIIDAVLVFLCMLALTQLVGGLWRASRWATARRYERLLQDPRRAAEVPPLESQVKVLKGQFLAGRPTLRRGLVVALVVALLVGAKLIPNTDDPTKQWSVTDWQVIATGGAIGAFLLVTAAYFVRRWLRARRVEHLSCEGEAEATTHEVPSAARPSVTRIPELSISFGAWPPVLVPRAAQVSKEQNLFGRTPWSILYLRLFDNEARLRSFLEAPWRECGYVHFMRAATSVSDAEIDAAKDGAAVFINSREWLEAELQGQPLEPMPAGHHELRKIGDGVIRVTDPLGSYPVRGLLIHGTFWRDALDLLLDRVDVVVLDLSGYQRDNVGTGYELQRVVDRFPLERAALIVDASSDEVFLEAQVREAWTHMTAGSPNATRDQRILMCRNSGNVAMASLLQHRLDARDAASGVGRKA